MADPGESTGEHIWAERDLINGIVKTSPIGIAVVDANGKVTFANERAEEIYGRSREELEHFSHDDPRWGLVNEVGEPLEPYEARSVEWCVTRNRSTIKFSDFVDPPGNGCGYQLMVRHNGMMRVN